MFFCVFAALLTTGSEEPLDAQTVRITAETLLNDGAREITNAEGDAQLEIEGAALKPTALSTTASPARHRHRSRHRASPSLG